MTPQEKAAIEAKAAARAEVMSKWGNGAVQFTDEDAKHMTPFEVTQAINAGRFEGVGRDKRLNRR